MTSPLDQIPRLAELLAETGLDTLELSGPAGGVRLCRGSATATAPVFPDAVAESERAASDTVAVASPGIGAFLRAHPLHDEPLAQEGASVAAGQVLALLRVGALLQPVRAPEGGILAVVRAREGELVGHGDPLFDIAPSR